MIYFLYGGDSYRSRAKLREIIAEYKKRHGNALDLHFFDAEDDDPLLLDGFFKSQSLFQKKKLVVLERPTRGSAAFQSKWKSNAKLWAKEVAVIVAIWDDAEEKNIKLFLKNIPSDARIQEYGMMTPRQAETYLAQYAKEKKINLSASKVKELASRFSSNTWQLVTEAEKVALGGEPGEPLDLPQEKIFGFLDAAFLDARGSLRALTRLRHGGEDEYYIFAALVNHVRTLLLCSDGEAPQGVHPFVVKKAREKIKKLNPDILASVYEKLFFEDAKTKIGVSDPYSSLVQILLATSSLPNARTS